MHRKRRWERQVNGMVGWFFDSINSKRRERKHKKEEMKWNVQLSVDWLRAFLFTSKKMFFVTFKSLSRRLNEEKSARRYININNQGWTRYLSKFTLFPMHLAVKGSKTNNTRGNEAKKWSKHEEWRWSGWMAMRTLTLRVEFSLLTTIRPVHVETHEIVDFLIKFWWNHKLNETRQLGERDKREAGLEGWLRVECNQTHQTALFIARINFEKCSGRIADWKFSLIDRVQVKRFSQKISRVLCFRCPFERNRSGSADDREREEREEQ